MPFAIPASRSHRLIGCLAAALLLASLHAAAAEDASAAGANAPPPGDAEKFCTNIVDAASDARFAWEAKTLKDLRGEIETATAALEAKRAELQEVLTRRDEFQKLADAGVVEIYAKMRPEAAAAQLGALDERTAAAVLAKLNSRTASAILGEMDIPRAVLLAQLISTGGEPQQSGATPQ